MGDQEPEKVHHRFTESPPWRVFLSHTADLMDSRGERSFVSAAEAAVIRAGHAVTDMAYFAARDHEPAAYCEAKVADANVYIAVVGLRYGSPVRGRTDRSYAEIEYEAASACGLPRLIFMMREDSKLLPVKDQPIELAVRQDAFRRRLLDEAGLTIAWFSTPGELEISVFQALVELQLGLPQPRYPHVRLRELRGGLYSQEEMAERADVSLSTYRSWEAGRNRPQPRSVRRLCEILGVEEHVLGFGSPADSHTTTQPRTQSMLPRMGMTRRNGLPDARTELPPAVQSSQDEWRNVRHHMATQGASLTTAAARLYPEAMRVGSTPLLTREDWLPDRPIAMQDLRLDWIDGQQRKRVQGDEPEARMLLPLRAPGRQFERYTAAVRHLDRPTLFENQPTYRLLEAAVAGSPQTLRFSLGTYFDMIDVSQMAAYELASQHRRSSANLTLERLPFRSMVGDPFDLHRRPVQAAVNVLTVRLERDSGSATFLLHWRDPSRVAVGGGMYSVMPVGVFQPSTVDPWGQHEDFDLWRNVVREFSEEFLGMPEHDGSSGSTIDYDMWPLYRALTRARDAGSLRISCLGLGVDPLGLGVDIVTVALVDSEIFDEVFEDLVQVNEEGHVVFDGDRRAAQGFPFTEQSVNRFLEAGQMGPGGAACLVLAWRHREALLSR